MTTDDKLTIKPGMPLRGTTSVPGDKSISHRAILLGALGNGATEVRGWLAAGDTEATLGAVQALGIQIDRHDTHTLTVHGGTLKKPDQPLDFVNAGTGIRLAAGVMAGQPFESVLDGSYQLRRRPMKRITEPLQAMGAHIESTDGKCPLTIKPAVLKGVRYEMNVASAQVKSALLLAALFADGPTTVVQPGPARDHTERMLSSMGAQIVVEGNDVTLTPGAQLQPMNLTVPGDFSSAAFLIVAALIVPDSDITITGVNLNDTRTGLLDVLLEMGGNIQVTETGLEAGEPIGDLRVQSSQLRGTTVGGDMVVRMIDEFPVLMIAALNAQGETLVHDARELRVKETDRISVMAGELRKLGAQIEEREDGFRIIGQQRLMGAVVDGHDDHRVAMSLAVAGLAAAEMTVVTDARCAGDSFPGFAETLVSLGGGMLPQAVE
ncbi:3-phosphoshikimate 1-carboxyvinyltransferase [Phototrophicus methaneseepsis]|uniref:3-phosphoshikimate 1-carboxyvinyltransferase n=1 Tax=Phototrophicus methaneseepsis TaxID=2710758 RepID=A0A7S8E5L4_9CHLR|nr:3-phosphoshikimate 1-carboxyvinyltransferase [Phototrophicus methaneseepsis]QPC80780.1 3-phosphoshikimate 1-carboxyvinyltransferase [Phototrophicus methaneseepsis]